MPPLAIRWAKRSLNAILIRELTAFADQDAALEALTMLSNDHAEAVSAFLDKRKPARYTGSGSGTLEYWHLTGNFSKVHIPPVLANGPTGTQQRAIHGS